MIFDILFFGYEMSISGVAILIGPSGLSATSVTPISQVTMRVV